MNFPRASGILLHLTSLPGEFGIGDLGPTAFKFADFLAQSGQTYWQVLPLGPTGWGDSPYSSFSAFAGNPLLISPEKLFLDELVTAAEIAEAPEFPADRVDYGAVYEWKRKLLENAFARFGTHSSAEMYAAFETFCAEESSWLEDYSLFRAVKNSHGGDSWQKWNAALLLRRPEALEKARSELSGRIEEEKFYQWTFFRQWFELKQYCSSKGLKIVGDIPMFVAIDSADVWCGPSQFKLDEDGSPNAVAGVPPDFFSKTGQLWGSPVYHWDRMRRDGFRWWIDRFKHMMRMVDIVRVDHFRGFAGTWEVPGRDKTAEHGKWVSVPGGELFDAARNEIGELPFWAEDLGDITPDVKELLDTFGFPGMRILQYAFGGDAGNPYLPHNYINNCIAYTGTHDNDTVRGWYLAKGTGKAKRRNAELSYCLKYLNSDGSEIHWDFIRGIWSSVADTAIAPLQDVLGLGNEARMNVPAGDGPNWQWRTTADALSPDVAERLLEITRVYGRAARFGAP